MVKPEIEVPVKLNPGVRLSKFCENTVAAETGDEIAKLAIKPAIILTFMNTPRTQESL